MGAKEAAEGAKKTIDTANDSERAARLLRNAGVNEEGIRLFTSSPELVASVINDPMVAISAAQSYPSATASAYSQASQQYGLENTDRLTFEGSGGADALAHNVVANKGYVVNPDTGAFKLDNGVIVDPTQGINGILFPPNSPDVEGSDAWFDKVQETWNKQKVESWRKRLVKWGAEIPSSGGFDWDFRNALDQYHRYRYLNRGKVIPIGGGSGATTKKDFDGALDPSILKAEVNGWSREIFGVDLEDDEAQAWAERIAAVALRVANKKGYSPGNAAAVAQTRVQEELMDTPEAEFAVRSGEEQADLKDALINAARATDFLAIGS